MAPPTMHPEMQVLLNAREQTNAQLGQRGDDPADARRWWNTYAAILGRPHPEDMHVHDRTIPTAAADVPVRVYQPGGASGAQPCILYMHGGGFMLGDLDSSDSIAWGYAHETGATVVSVDYRLTPQYPYPAAFNDCYGVLSWLASNPAELGIDAERIALAGDSAGGTMSAVLALAARDRGGPAIVAQALLYPWLGLDPDSASYHDFANGAGLTTAATNKFNLLYLPPDLAPDDYYARPLRAQDYSGLPPALVHAAEMDPIRDDSRAYAAQLVLAGNAVTYREARGMIHGFLRARFHGPAARAEFEVACHFLREHLAV